MSRCITRFLLVISVVAFSGVTSVYAQAREITGTVTDGETGNPLPGVNITVQGTTTGTTSSINGEYSLQAESGDVLVFSFIGYQTQEVPVESQQVIDVVMQQAVGELGEVVVVGYGTQRRGNVTGAVSSIDVEDAGVGLVTSPADMIQGRAAGVRVIQANGEPGAGMNIRIRGGTSISSSNDPLYVIDGVPINNAPTEPGGSGISGAAPRNPLNMLNPNDIASIDILKGASATAIYGARGANGVVVITTKSGRAGEVRVTYNGYVSSSAMYRKMNLLTASQYRNFVTENNLGNNLGQASTDWQDAMTRRAISQSHNIAFSGGTENTQYRASLGYLNENGIIISSGIQRLSARLNADHQALNNRLQIGLNFTSAFLRNDHLPYQQTGGFSGGLFTNVMKMNPTFPIKIDADGDGKRDEYFEYPTPSIRNPVALARQIDDFSKTTRTLASLNASLDLFAGLSAGVNLGADRSQSSRRLYFPSTSPVGSPVGGSATQRNRELSSLLIETTLNYQGTVFQGHTIDAVGGYSFQKFYLEGFGATMRDFVTDAWKYNNLSGGADNSIKPYSTKQTHKLISFFGRVNYNINNTYLATATLRRDGSSRFGAGNKWGLFPSGSAAWRISNEPFLEDVDVLSELKLRVGYGVTGSQEIGNYNSLPTLAPNPAFIFVIGENEREIVGVAPNNYANPDLQWEETTSLNVGLDWGLQNGRFNGTINYYVKNTDNLLLEIAVPQPAVVPTRLENIGKMKNSGIELSFDALAVDRQDLSVQVGAVFTANRNEVVSLGGRERIITADVSGAGMSGVNAQIIKPGQPLGTFFGPKFLGIENGQQIFEDLNAQGEVIGTTTEPGGEDRQIIGNAQPNFTYGFDANVYYKNWDFSFFFRGVQGMQVFNNTALEYTAKYLANTNVNFLEDALSDGTAIDEAPVYSSRWIQNGSFLRLDNVTLGYTFDAISSLRNLRVYVTGQNLFLITPYEGYDPEVNTDAGLATLGIDYTNYPTARTITVGVNLGL